MLKYKGFIIPEISELIDKDDIHSEIFVYHEDCEDVAFWTGISINKLNYMDPTIAKKLIYEIAKVKIDLNYDDYMEQVERSRMYIERRNSNDSN